MFNKFRSNKPQAEIDQQTGEIISKPASAPVLPSLKDARRVEEIAGIQPEYINLKDHPELNGCEIAIVAVSVAAGEFGKYVKLGVYKIENGEVNPVPFVIMTGAENVYARALAIQDDATSETPVLGVLRQVGDAWLLD